MVVPGSGMEVAHCVQLDKVVGLVDSFGRGRSLEAGMMGEDDGSAEG